MCSYLLQKITCVCIQTTSYVILAYIFISLFITVMLMAANEKYPYLIGFTIGIPATILVLGLIASSIYYCLQRQKRSEYDQLP